MRGVRDGRRCASDTCNGGTCALLGAEPCAAASDCAAGFCLNGYCISSSTAGVVHAHGVQFPLLPGWGAADVLSKLRLPDNGPCIDEACPAPPGSYCESNAYCASGKCGPAALLSFPKCM